MINYIILLILCSLSVHGGEVPAYQISSLQALYNSTYGANWNWQVDETFYGVPWNFTNINGSFSNPCISAWQGIGCSPNCSSSNICNITEVTLNSFSLVGTIPTALQALNTLQILDLTNNAITGTVPTMLAELTQLSVINFENCAMTGSIPTQLALLSNSLSQLWLNFNDFTNTTIPSELSQLTLLTYLELGGTCLSGSIPTWLGSLSALEVLGLYEQHLTGTIPSYIGLMSKLAAVAFSDNFLSGTIPTTFSQATNLFFFSCRYNKIHGPGVDFLVQLPKMEVLLLSGNQLTGNIAVPSVSSVLQVLRVDNNMFTGSDILSSVCENMALVELLAGSNFFTGSIPSCVANWMCIVNLDISDNKFTGTIPAGFNQFSSLETLVLSANGFRGDLLNVFNSSMLTTVVVSDNGFSGSLPVDIFKLSRLTTVIASKNCFSGTLSSELCSANNLQTLALSGLTAGSRCVTNLPLLNIYEMQAFAGTIPSCLFAMPSLMQLYLDGNAIKSNIYDVSDNSLLRNISMSHNRLSGYIPPSIQTRQNIQTLDLSFNRLLGTIADMDQMNVSVASTEVILHANHLSGRTPDSFTHSPADIDVLAGNLFACHDTSELPHNDPRAKKYSCGSTVLYDTMYCCVALLGSILLSVAVVYFRNVDFGMFTSTFRLAIFYLFMGAQSHMSVPEARLTGDDGSVAMLMDHIAVVLGQHRQFCLFIGGLIACVCVPILMTLKAVGNGKYLTMTHQYGWWCSLGYIDGITPGVVIATFWLCLLIVAMSYEYSFINRKALDFSKFIKGNRRASTSIDPVTGQPQTAWMMTGVGIMINLILSLTANSAYVYVVMTGSATLQALAVWMLVVYKLVWMYVVVVPWLRKIHAKFLLILWVLIFNVIIIPMLATMAVDVSCFKSTFSPEPDITTSYTYYHCNSWSGHNDCLEYIPISTSVSFSAPIIYNNQCFAAVLTNYVPIYIITYGFIGIGACCIHIATTVFLQHSFREQNERVLTVVRRLQKLDWFPLKNWLPIESVSDLVEESPDFQDTRYRANFYRARFHAMHCVLVLTLLLTFGLAYPPLGVVLIVNIVLHTLVFQLSVYYHYKQMEYLPAECLDMWKLVLMDEIRMLHKVIHGSRTALYIFSSVFASFALYDITSIADSGLAVALILLVIIGASVGTVLCKQLRVNDISVTRVGRSMSMEMSAGIARIRSASSNSNTSKNSDADNARGRSASSMSAVSDDVQNPMSASVPANTDSVVGSCFVSDPAVAAAEEGISMSHVSGASASTVIDETAAIE